MIKNYFIECSWGRVNINEINSGSDNPVICLHGWLDNWSSFLPLSQYLEDRLLCLDLPGHGLSEHLPEGNHYHFVDYIVRLSEVTQKLNLNSFHLIGHSMGAAIGSLFAATFPEKVRSLTMIDGLGPLVSDPQDARDVLRESIKKIENGTYKKRAFKDKELAIKARLSAGNLEYESAKILVDNQLKQTGKGWSWTYDYKLKNTSSLRLSPEQLRSFLMNISCPSLLIKAKSGFIQKAPYINDKKLITKLEEVELGGNHHLHMDNAKEVSTAINNFIRAL